MTATHGRPRLTVLKRFLSLEFLSVVGALVIQNPAWQDTLYRYLGERE